MDLEELVFRFAAQAPDLAWLRAAWLEGPEGPGRLPAPDRPLDLHLGVEEPDLERAFDEHGALLQRFGPLASHEDGAAEFEGRCCRARFRQGDEVLLTLERMALVGKRSRGPVRVLYDRTGRILGCFTYRR